MPRVESIRTLLDTAARSGDLHCGRDGCLVGLNSMCFSATASFSAGAVLLVIGSLTLRSASRPRALPFAAKLVAGASA